MIIVKNTIVSDDIADRHFCCDLRCCHGACCVEGDSGAPLREEEVPVLEAIRSVVAPYMTPEGREAVAQQGVAVRDNDGDLGTPLIEGGACAYITYADDGTALCAIEKAYREIPDSELRKLNFPKPVSCHLYPIRVEDYGEFTAVNYHQWDVCRQGERLKMKGERCADAVGGNNLSPLSSHLSPLYVYLKEPLIRRFGQEWYDELLQEIGLTPAPSPSGRGE